MTENHGPWSTARELRVPNLGSFEWTKMLGPRTAAWAPQSFPIKILCLWGPARVRVRL